LSATFIDGAHVKVAAILAIPTETTVRRVHFLHEDSPDKIGVAVAQFVRELPSA
jgi:hypothetical protein